MSEEFKESTVYTRTDFIKTLRYILQQFNTEIPVVVEGVNENIFSYEDTYGVVSIIKDDRGAKNINTNKTDYNMNYINRTTTTTLRFLSPSADELNACLDSFYEYIECTELRYKCSRANINILEDYDIRTYKDVSPYDSSKHCHIGLISMTVTYVNRVKDFVGVINDAEVGFGIETGGVFYNDNIDVPPQTHP